MKGKVILMSENEMINLSGGSILSVKKWAIEFIIQVGEGIAEDVIAEAWDCFWESFE